mmetsp:Transcript_6723/g.9190  ORF Transcript_6723/g.9190 Transcript_6723/m.9190 type:complete len:347 (+) Transcript_6723:591-1631(+)|eukprot:CAMPEP_0185574360 /NCGR_PEP_ID=MMETSP0434-20130131/5847_1 /TAXON_ID=626734 ORGANISM="Favella taraikaensis, Strain Fe Narragansett Bay" /NCGR_SAMPLE_ID=MMETSP0434 /ASSEMBLY_ACC=CAM_ASM_000379 /LENGTH=346 /DNA_ID=CAMNT_0028190905 /DNA_START=558 /DNA_END=1598 /DNA_ORIENTATION=-
MPVNRHNHYAVHLLHMLGKVVNRRQEVGQLLDRVRMDDLSCVVDLASHTQRVDIFGVGATSVLPLSVLFQLPLRELDSFVQFSLLFLPLLFFIILFVFLDSKQVIIRMVPEQDSNPFEAKEARQDISAIGDEVSVASLSADNTRSSDRLNHFPLDLLLVFDSHDLLDLGLDETREDVEELLIEVGEAAVQLVLAFRIFLLPRHHLDAGEQLAVHIENWMGHVRLGAHGHTSVLVFFELGLGHVLRRRIDHVEGAPFQHRSLQLELVLHELLAQNQVLLRDENATALTPDHIWCFLNDQLQQLRKLFGGRDVEQVGLKFIEAVHIASRVVVDFDGATVTLVRTPHNR